jgi:Domain of unknown function (DUF4407)
MKIFKPFPKRTKRTSSKIQNDMLRPPVWERLKTGVGHGTAALATKGRSLTLFMAGSAPAEVSTIPSAEVRSLRVDGALLLLSMGINAAIWTSALVTAGKPWLAALPVGGFVALIIGLFDRQILSAVLNIDGELIMKQRGMRGFYPLDRRRKWILTSARILLSFASMWAAIMLLRVALFAPDIEAHLAQNHIRENAAVRVTATKLVDAQLGDLRSVYEKAMIDRNELRKLESDADAPANTEGPDGEMEAARAEITKARADLEGMSQERAEHLRGASAEDAGVKEQSGDTGRPGRGNQFAFHQRRAQDILREMNLRYRLMKVAEARLTSLAQERQSTITAKQSSGMQAREMLSPRMDAANVQVASMSAKLKQLQDHRPAAIDTMMSKDASYVALRTGLMARVTALDEVTQGSWSAWLLSLALSLVCSILELAVVWARAMLGTPHPAGFMRVANNIAAIEAMEVSARRRRKRSTDLPPILSQNDNFSFGDEEAA